MSVVQLARKLIAVPSYPGEKTNEKDVGDFVYDYLRRFSFLRVRKQRVAGGRFNVIAASKGVPRLFLAGHLDTVEPKQGWMKSQFSGTIEGAKLFGLGALDTKSGIAAMLDALNDFKRVSGLTLLFYCDEEYDFLGMKKFLNAQRKSIGDLAVLAEPTDLKIWNTHRGLVEILFSIQGQTGHAADPTSGRNAISGMLEALGDFRRWLLTFRDPALGEPSLNIAYLRGGLNLGGGRGSEIVLGSQGNNIADFAEAVIDIRPTKPELRAGAIIRRLEEILTKNGFRLRTTLIRHDFGSFYTDPQKLESVESVMRQIVGKAEYLDPAAKGYGDGQLLQERFQVPVVYIGPKGARAHGANEWVDIASLRDLRAIYGALVRKYCQ